ncbi:Major facilitator superfamily domain, general substrate transporter [Metarhizium robertsii ARSEF 23]|uniref:Major facilitator superfamily domain, general substrate transporter n=1 Tax=Metarhizium robertsii (strain ARSEF 23 / ATCC MYA-3075) TaxID=655844 RepID=E9F8E3_METRA|nr:Major facilitator superfamily domain, general substrate transporter [Metarhizium robertsii ARSEF 23]EFY96050.2 Major facilitator superfamily domain, general substrate transporter [Metarhizium robertsii ARSEF 23]
MSADIAREAEARHDKAQESIEPAEVQHKTFWQAALPVFACGAGLFSDGYINNVIGSVNTVLGIQYGSLYKDSQASMYVADIAFAGTVVGQLLFGFLSDRWSRSNSLVVSTIILIIFTALAAGSYYRGDTIGMFNILAAWRFFVGIGIGGEYPAGSVGCAESTGDLKKGTRHRWFILFTNTMINCGFVFGAFLPYVIAAAAHNTNYSTIWRTSLGIGVVFPLVLLLLRMRLKEPEEFTKEAMRRQTPYILVLKFYWFRLLCVSLIWFLYNFSVYAFGIYSSSILSGIYDDQAPLTTIFGWNTVINMFYLPGSIIGSFVSDKLGPKYTLILGVSTQAVVGYIMAGVYGQISNKIAPFAIVYGIFLSLGELGPGNNIGLLAAKTCATGVRGRYYGIAAAMGKIGAFIGTWVFPYIQAAGGNKVQSAQYPFWVASSLSVLSAVIAFFFMPNIGQDTIADEDIRFRDYLESQGWDTRQLGFDSKDPELSAGEKPEAVQKTD